MDDSCGKNLTDCDIVRVLVFLVGTVIIVMLATMHGSWRARKKIGEGQVLEYNGIMKAFPIAINATFLVLMIVVAYFINKFKAGMTGEEAIPLLFLIMVFLTWVPYLQYWGVFFVLTQEGIQRCSFWAGDSSLKWGDMETIKFSSQSKLFVVQGHGTKVRLSMYLDGIGDFVQQVSLKVPPQNWASARKQIESVLIASKRDR